MKILLVNPPYPFEESPSPPFGLMSLAGYVLEKGFDVRIEDYVLTPFSEAQARSVVRNYDPVLVGSTAVTMNVNKAIQILKVYKTIAPQIVTVMGGPHVTFDAERILNEHPYIDCIVRGEGELTLHEMLQCIKNGTGFDRVDGISCRYDGRVRHNPERQFIEDINILPYPARHLVALSKYKAMGLPVNMVTSRGCPNNCVFCVGRSMVGRKVRYFSTARVVDEFEMIAKMGFKQINIVDDLFTSHKRRCIEICDEIVRRKAVYPWTAFARVDTVSRELLEHMREAGCTTLCYGVESGNQEILDRVKKKITLEKCQEAVDLAKNAGIEILTSYILGLPGETPETVQNTLEFAKKLSPCYGFHILAPFLGTEVREKSEEYGIRILTDDWDRYDANRSVAESMYISSGEIDRVYNEFNASIDRYVNGIGNKKKRGEAIKPEEDRILSNILDFDFAKTLIVNELIEQYVGAADQDIGEHFIEYIREHTDYERDHIRSQVDRLLRLSCIIIDAANNTVRWNS